MPQRPRGDHPAGPDAEKLAEEARVRLLNQVLERRGRRTKATVNQLLDKHLSQADLDVITLDLYKGYADSASVRFSAISDGATRLRERQHGRGEWVRRHLYGSRPEANGPLPPHALSRGITLGSERYRGQ